MIEFDLRRWPIVVGTLRDRFTVADAAAYVDAFDRFFARGEPFAVALVYADEIAAAEERDTGAGPILTRWLRSSHGLVSDHCRGMATVVAFLEVRAAMAGRLAGVGRAFGCPVALFATRAEADAWLGDRLAPSTASSTTAAREETQP